MSAAVKITRTDQTANELRRLASKEADGGCVRRLLGIALVLEGQTRETAAREAGMERQTLRDWVHRYNAQDLAGLRSIRGGGRSPHLSPAQMAELQALTLKGPDPATHKVVCWRCVDLRAEVAQRFDVMVDEPTIGKRLPPMRSSAYYRIMS